MRQVRGAGCSATRFLRSLPNKFNMAMRVPMGVAGIITPWNFPMAIPTWKIFPALLCGNTVVFKPASDTPRRPRRWWRSSMEAGVPEGVVNIVHGGGGEVGNGDRRPPGGGPRELHRLDGGREERSRKSRPPRSSGSPSSSAGRTPSSSWMMRILDLALDGVLWGAFGTTGQRCTATSRLILHEKIHDRFLADAGRTGRATPPRRRARRRGRTSGPA